MEGLAYVVGIVLAVVLFVAEYLIALSYVSGWQVFRKAGKPGWASLIPFYCMIVLLEIAEKPIWWFFLLFIPGVNIVFAILINIGVAERFGRSPLFGGLGLSFLGSIFYPILASSQTEPLDVDYFEKGRSRIRELGLLLSSLLVYIVIFYPLSYGIDWFFRRLAGMPEPPPDNQFPVMADWGLWSIRAMDILCVACAIAVWKGKRWGVYAFVAFHIGKFVINVVNGFPVGASVPVFLVPLVLVLLVRPVWDTLE